MDFKKVGVTVSITAILILYPSIVGSLGEDTVKENKLAVVSTIPRKPATLTPEIITKNAVVKPVVKPDYYRTTSDGIKISKNDYELLVHLVHAEAGVDNISSQIGVVNVVLNRVRSDRFQESIYAVIHAKNQFEVVSNGTINQQPDRENYEAVDRALAGENTVGNCVHFWDGNLDRSNSIWEIEVKYRYGSTVFGGSY
ncbi:TPA: cell wall hydrolase [Clostridium botulinum]|uniref:cell wall hydrolase n=1 Tax=Clostridium botulinum TaxID=1491 RepID=UPI001C9AB6AF|nr:cell wall hydrolase [Clostridium botulinum]MBY6909536.1 cell wall hydrolase [Clostridium botulinum]